MSDVITLFCPVNARPGCGEKMKKALVELAAVTIREPGNICYRPHATKDPDRFLIYEQWRDADALKTHCASPHLAAFLADREGILLEEPHGTRASELEVK
ncbi:MAG: antibiotic biosynthesis monooxygenase [Lentisphaeria bacterium]|nr:antibiotic biosynthesis monooxygenase [Lentisphaeria bacterium]